MLKKISIPLFLFLLSSFLSNAQPLKDNFYVKVLSQELNRNMQRLHLPELSKPFLISYRLRNGYSHNIRAERGHITSLLKEPSNNKVAVVKLLVGDYHRNFDHMQYGGFSMNLPDEDNADEIRRLLWLETDRAYKATAQQYNATMASLKRVNVDKKELELDDLSKITPVVKDFGAMAPLKPDQQHWEAILKELSLLFTKHPELTTSYTQVNFSSYEDYLVTSEGTITRQPAQSVSFTAYASANDEQGNTFNDSYTFYAKNISELPSQEVLKNEILNIIETIKNARTAKKFENAYLGPVLFMNDAAPALMSNLFGSSLIVRRKSILGYSSFGATDYEDKLGQKLVAADLSVTALPKLVSFNGISTTGSFQIDDEGVEPPDSLALIKNGILTSLLNGRVPTQKFPRSQGFVRSFSGRAYNPGVLRIQSANTTVSDSMKQRLIKIAKEEGLPYAYIVKDRDYTTADLYKVDVKTAQEELVTANRIANFNIRSMRRFVTASDKQVLYNTPTLSIITPESFIINEVEIEKQDQTVKPKPIIVSNPLLDSETTAVKTSATKKRRNRK